MVLNLIKEYSNLLELLHLTEQGRKDSLKAIFKRDIEENLNFKFKNKQIRPIKKTDGISSLETLFTHLTTEDDYSISSIRKRKFEIDRSNRLHWIKFHIEERIPDQIQIFSVLDRTAGNNRKRTYIYDKEKKYVIILELQRSGNDYYLITAYYLNKTEGVKQIEKKYKNKLDYIF